MLIVLHIHLFCYLKEFQVSSEGWDQNWPTMPGSPPCLRPGTDLSDLPLKRLRWAFEKASVFYSNQVEWFRRYTPVFDQISNSEGTRHEFLLLMEPPVGDWRFLGGEIFNHLSSARDNLFKEIVKRSTGLSDKEIKKQFGNVYWPTCFQEQEWESLAKRFDCIPKVIMDRIEVFQPFRDRHIDGKPADIDWKRSSVSAWSRRLNNDDKHDQPPEVAFNYYLGDSVIAHKAVTFTSEPQQRWDTTDPLAADPILTLHTAHGETPHITIPYVDIVLMIRSSSHARWSPFNSGVWSALVESQMVLNTVYYGRDRADALQIPWVYATQDNWADFRYELNSTGGYDLLRRSNLAQKAISQNYI